MSQKPNIETELFGAIDVILSEHIKGLQFDQTKKCTITDVKNAHNGEYTVTDGSITFQAYSEKTDYKVDDAVRVSIPNADYGDKKYIIGKCVSDSSAAPITYVSPLESILDITNNIIPDNTSKIGLIANDEKVGTLLASIDMDDVPTQAKYARELYDTFYVAAEFQSLLGDYHIVNGSYGIRIDFYDAENDQTKCIFFDSKDMFGDPYSFNIFTTQYQTYNLQDVERIDRISLWFYQDNQFEHDTNGERERVPVPNPPKKNYYNLLVTNFKAGFGVHMSNIEDNTVRIYSNDYKWYDQLVSSSRRKILKLLWYNKNEAGKYIGFNDKDSKGFPDSKAYSELGYLKKSAEDKRLLDQLSNKDVPHDERGVNIAADKKDLNNDIDKIFELVNDNILFDLENFNKETNNIYNIIDSSENTTDYYYYIKSKNENLNKLRQQLNQQYGDILKWAAKKYNPKNSNNETFGEPEEIPQGAIVSMGFFDSDLDHIIKKLQEFLSISVSKSYQGIFDKYSKKINEYIQILNNYSSNFVNYVDYLMPDAINVYIVDEEYSITEEYKGEDYSDYANYYSIYWYRYDPNNLLNENDYIAGDPFVHKNWKRIKSAGYSNQVIAVPDPGLDPENLRDDERFMAIIFYNHEAYASNILTFENISKSRDITTESLTDYILLQNGYKSQEAYQFYGETNFLVNNAEANYDREIILQYMKNDTTPDNSKLDDCQIYWYLPESFTMLEPSLKNQQIQFGKDTEHTEQSRYYSEGYICYYQAAVEENTNRSFYYKIKNYYMASATQNHIKCKVISPKGFEYEETINFTFASYGTSGTDYTLQISPIGEQSAVLKDKPLQLKLFLYDYNNRLIDYDFDENKITIDSGNYSKTFKNNTISISKVNNNKYYGTLIVEAQVILENRTVNLKSYYPLSYAEDNYFIEGANTIVYSDAGNKPQYYKDPYKLYKWSDKTEETEINNWYIVDETGDPNNHNVMPTVHSNKIIPCVMYLDGVSMRPVVRCDGYYYQSIYICQNRYPSAMLNEWDNSLTIDEKKGIILSSIIGAGKKDLENKFYGVLMGNIQADVDTGDHNGYGLYGFHAGVQSFGFNVDGTAFLGKSGRGRIVFNGNTGTIESASYQIPNSGGMKIDLDDGWIEMRGDKNYLSTNSKIYLGTIPKDKAYFSIDSENGNRLIHVGIDDYYLQTDNFGSNNKINYINIYDENGNALLDDYGNAITIQASSNYSNVYDENGNVLIDDEGNLITTQSIGAGTKIDLKNGKITSYDFTIDARSGNNHLLLSSSAELYPLIINDTFKVDWTGAMFSTSGVIGFNPATGQLFISGNQIVTGGAKDNHSGNVKSIVYLQKGTSTNLNLENIGYGTVNNDFYLGAGGLIFKNTSSETDYGMRLTSAGLVVDGANANWIPEGIDLSTTFDKAPQFSAFYQGYGITLVYKQNDNSILFNKAATLNTNFIGFTETGGLSIISNKNNILIEAEFISLIASKKIHLGGNDLYQSLSDEQGVFALINLVNKKLEAEVELRFNNDNKLKDNIQNLETQIESLQNQIDILERQISDLQEKIGTIK